MHSYTLAAITSKLGGVLFPLRIMMRDISQAKFTIVAVIFPSEIERLAVTLRKDCKIDISDRTKVISIIFAHVTPCVTARAIIESRTFFGDMLRLGCNRSMLHGKVSAVADRASILAQMIAISKKE